MLPDEQKPKAAHNSS